jgi:hypothetical protein
MSMSFELVPTEWFDENAIQLPDYKVGRVNFGQGRSYIRISPDGQLENPFRLYTSLTTSIAQSMPTPKALEDWKFQHGKKEADRLMKVAAHYGTMMHIEIGKFIKEKVYDLDSCNEVVEDYTSENNFWDNDCVEWQHKLKEDMLAFAQFYNDYEVIPLGLEYVLLSDERGFGTPIDLVCFLTVTEDGFDYNDPYKSGPRKGEPREVKVKVQKRAIINFKSGRKGFYETHGIQMECERLLWDENFPDSPIDVAMNWAPADWKTNPTYKVKEWQGTTSKEEIEAILKLAQIRYQSKAEKRKYMSMSGCISTTESVAAAVQFEDVEDFCTRKFSSTPAPVKQRPATMQAQSIPVSKPVFTPQPMPI